MVKQKKALKISFTRTTILFISHLMTPNKIVSIDEDGLKMNMMKMVPCASLLKAIFFSSA